MSNLEERLQRMLEAPQVRKRGQVSREDVALARQYQRQFVHVGAAFNTDAIPDCTESLEQMRRDMRAARELRDMMWEDHAAAQLMETTKQLVLAKAKKLAQETAMLAQLKTEKDKWLMAIELRLTEYLLATLSTIDTAVRASFFASINASNGQTPLHRACKTNDKALVTLLLSLGATLTVKDDAGKSIFHLVAEHNLTELYQLLIGQLSPADELVLLALDRAGLSLLHAAAQSGSDAMLALLLNGPHAHLLCPLVNTQTARERATALHLAAQHGHTQCVKLLLQTPGVRASVCNASGSNALHMALQQTFHIDALIGVFLDASSCVATDVDEMLQSLDERTGRNCLHTTIIQSFRSVTFALLQNKHVQLSIATRSGGWSPLHLAVMAADLGIVQALLDAGSMLDMVDNDGQTPLLLACLSGSLAIVRLLLAAGANPAHQNKQAHSALHYLAAFCRDQQLLQDVIDRGADVNAKSLKLNTPLHFAAMNGNDIAAQVLLAHGASASALNEDKRSVVYLAKKWRHKAVEDLVKPPDESVLNANSSSSRSNPLSPPSSASSTVHAARAFAAQQLQNMTRTSQQGRRPPHSARSEDSDDGDASFFYDFEDEAILPPSTPYPIELFQTTTTDTANSQRSSNHAPSAPPPIQSQSFRELRDKFLALALTPHRVATLEPVVLRHRTKQQQQQRDATTASSPPRVLHPLVSPSTLPMTQFTRKFLAQPVAIPWDMTVPVPRTLPPPATTSSSSSESTDALAPLSTATATSLQRKLKPSMRNTHIGRFRDHLAHTQALSWPQHAAHATFRNSSLKYQAPVPTAKLT